MSVPLVKLQADVEGIVSGKVTNRILQRCYMDGLLDDGDCIAESAKCYLKLKKAGAKRVRGIREYDRTLGSGTPHYWVENKGMVFDCSLGQQIIYKKDKFYETQKIQNAEVAEKLWFRDEIQPFEKLDPNFYEWTLTATDEQLVRMVNNMESLMQPVASAAKIYSQEKLKEKKCTK